MSDNKKRKSRKQYLNDFVMTPNGYVYAGKNFTYLGENYKSFKLKLLIADFLLIILILFCGFIPSSGMDNSFYVIIPYVVEIAFGGSICWASFRIMFHGNVLREYIYQSTVQSLPLRCILYICAAIVSAMATLISLVLSDATIKIIVSSIIVIACKIVAVVVALLLRRVVKNSHWA